MTTFGSDGWITDIIGTVNYLEKRRQWDGASLHEDSTRHPQKGPHLGPLACSACPLRGARS